MVGETDRTISPSSSSTSRRTPCVLGCWGPMFTVMVSVLSSGIVGPSASRASVVLGASAARQAVPHHVGLELGLRHLRGFRRLRFHPDLHGVVLAQRKTLPVFRHQQTARIGMTVECDAKEIPDFSLEPIRGGPDATHGDDMGIV